MSTATAVKERPILMNGEMVLATLEGRKTQTRRIAKLPLPASKHQPMSWWWNEKSELFQPVGSIGHLDVKTKGGVKSPFGMAGDRLWVRETFSPTCPFDNGDELGYVYRATDKKIDGDWVKLPWKPSIHMPRRASRITLEITGVRVERLNEISEDDAWAEGVDGGCLRCGEKEAECKCHGEGLPDYRDSFVWLWESINGVGSWDANPWVWVVEFKLL